MLNFTRILQCIIKNARHKIALSEVKVILAGYRLQLNTSFIQIPNRKQVNVMEKRIGKCHGKWLSFPQSHVETSDFQPQIQGKMRLVGST